AAERFRQGQAQADRQSNSLGQVEQLTPVSTTGRLRWSTSSLRESNGQERKLPRTGPPLTQGRSDSDTRPLRDRRGADLHSLRYRNRERSVLEMVEAACDDEPRVCCATASVATRLAPCSPKSTTGSPRDSTPQSSGTPRRCSSS